MDKLLVIGLIVINTFLASLGLILLKIGSNKFRGKKNIVAFIKFLFSKYILGGAFLYFIGTLIFVAVLKTQDLSYIYPLTAISYFFVIFLSTKFLKEKMNKYKWLGVLLIVIGVIVISI